jgi:hypothetical protein
LLFDGVDEIYGGTAKVWGTHAVGDYANSVVILYDITVEAAVVKEKLIAKARATTGLYGNPQGEVIAPLGIQEGLYFQSSGIGQDDTLARDLLSGDLLAGDLLGSRISRHVYPFVGAGSDEPSSVRPLIKPNLKGKSSNHSLRHSEPSA